MAPIGGPTGGGQAGFGSGGSFTGPAEALELAGSHCYSYSGELSVDGSLVTMNKFTTGNYLAEFFIEFHGFFAFIGQAQWQINILLNGSSIINTYWDATQDAAIQDFPTRLIIPAYTQVEIKMAQASGTPRDFSTTVTGRIYRD